MIDDVLSNYNYEKKVLNDLLYVLINNNDVSEILSLLKNNGFTTLIDCFAINTLNDNSNTIYYHLLNYNNNQSICVCTIVTNKVTRSITDIFKNANWYEREIYEMYNINFTGYNNLKKLFTE